MYFVCSIILFCLKDNGFVIYKLMTIVKNTLCATAEAQYLILPGFSLTKIDS